MREINQHELLENIWGFTVIRVVNRIREMCNRERILFELVSMENIKVIAKEEYIELKDFFLEHSPRYFAKSVIKRYIQDVGLITSLFYEEALGGDPMELLEIMDLVGEYDVVFTREKLGEDCIEICEDVYITNIVDSNDYLIQDYFEFVGMDWVCKPYDDCEVFVKNGNINRLCIGIENIFEVQKETKSKKIKKLIDYFMQCLVKLNGKNRAIAIIKDEFGENQPNIIFFEKKEDLDMDEWYIEEISNSAIMILVADILLEELKKEGYSY